MDNMLHFLATRRSIFERMENYCVAKKQHTFKTEEFVEQHLRQKFASSFSTPFPFVLPAYFYKLCKEMMGVQYEFFSDTVTYSEQVEHFCSYDKGDITFVSKGVWDAVEDIVSNATGFLALEKANWAYH